MTGAAKKTEDTMTNLKKILLRSAALSAIALAGFASAPAMAQGCPNGSDFGNRGVCNEAPAQNRPQQPAPDVAPQQQAPQAQPGRGGGGGRNRGSDQGNYRGGNNRNDNRGYGYDNRGYDNRGYDNRGYDRGYGNRGYGQGGYSYDQRSYPSYPSYGSYPSYDYQQSYAYPAAEPYYGGAMSEEQIAYVLQQQGFSRIETVDYATGQYTVDARDPSNRPMRLRVSATNGQILEAKYR